jgi:hypothetical protein
MAETITPVSTLSNPPFFNGNLTPAGDLGVLCTELWPLVMAYLPESRKRPIRKKDAFRSLVANFLMAMQTTEPELIAPRNKHFLNSASRYQTSFMTYDAVTKMLDAATEAGLIVQEIGSGEHRLICRYSSGMRHIRGATRVRPTDHLIQRLTSLLSLPIRSLIQQQEDAEVIHLRGAKKGKGSGEQVDYTDTPATDRFRAEVKRINQHLRQHPCHYAGKLRVNLMDDHVVRIFNNGDWQQGGRLYGYWPMNLPSGERPYLSIDGEPLADLDFGSCFVALLHVADGTEFDPEAPDPFTISGYENLRDGIKQCAYSIINASKKMSHYPEDVDWADGSKPPMRWRDMEEVIFTHVPLFERYAYRATGLKLMRQESDILISVLLDLIKNGVGFVPMHDGIMVPESKKQLTDALMLKHYQTITGQSIKIKDKTISKPRLRSFGEVMREFYPLKV